MFQFRVFNGKEDLVPGFLLLLLSQDKGTAGIGNFFCPGTKGLWDKKTFLSRDKETIGRPIPDSFSSETILASRNLLK